MPIKDTDTLNDRQEFVFIQVHQLLNKDGINTVNEALRFIADNLLFLSYKTVYRDYISYIRIRKASKF